MEFEDLIVVCASNEHIHFIRDRDGHTEFRGPKWLEDGGCFGDCTEAPMPSTWHMN